MQPHILLIEIPLELAMSLEALLSEQGYRVSQSTDTVPEPSWVRQIRPDLLIMNLPAADSPDLAPCRRLSVSLKKIPIMLLGRDEHDDRIAGLNVCANDYLAIPFVNEEFLARVRAKLRRMRWEKTDDVFTLADLRLDTEAREVHYKEQPIDLTTKEFDLLRYLMAHSRQVLTQQQILDEVWSESLLTDDSNVVQVYVRSLRQKLKPAGDLIQTVRGVGYVLKDHSTTSVI